MPKSPEGNKPELGGTKKAEDMMMPEQQETSTEANKEVPNTLANKILANYDWPDCDRLRNIQLGRGIQWRILNDLIDRLEANHKTMLRVPMSEYEEALGQAKRISDEKLASARTAFDEALAKNPKVGDEIRSTTAGTTQSFIDRLSPEARSLYVPYHDECNAVIKEHMDKILSAESVLHEKIRTINSDFDLKVLVAPLLQRLIEWSQWSEKETGGGYWGNKELEIVRSGDLEWLERLEKEGLITPAERQRYEK